MSGFELPEEPVDDSLLAVPAADARTIASQLRAFERELARLRPVAAGFDRDRLMFLAGRAAAEREGRAAVVVRGRWVWPSIAAAMTTVAALLLVAFVVRRPAPVTSEQAGEGSVAASIASSGIKTANAVPPLKQGTNAPTPARPFAMAEDSTSGAPPPREGVWGSDWLGFSVGASPRDRMLQQLLSGPGDARSRDITGSRVAASADPPEASPSRAPLAAEGALGPPPQDRALTLRALLEGSGFARRAAGPAPPAGD